MEFLDALIVYRGSSSDLPNQRKDLFERRKEAEDAARRAENKLVFEEIFSKEFGSDK